MRKCYLDKIGRNYLFWIVDNGFYLEHAKQIYKWLGSAIEYLDSKPKAGK